MKIHDYKSQFLFHINHEHRASPLAFGNVRLVQIGRMFCSPSTAIKPHVHLEWFELTIATSGKGIVEVNGERIPIEEGDIILSLPCDSHAVYSDEADPLKYDFFSFFCIDEGLQSQLERLTSIAYPASKRKWKDQRISYLISCSIDEMNADMPDSNSILTAIFTQVLLYVLRNYERPLQATSTHLSDTETLCYKIMQYLDTHVYTLKNLYELSDLTNYNYSYLSYVFKKTTGQTIAEYFQNKKLDTAKALLKEGKLKAGEIAELLNYSSIYSFSKAFKAYCGASPRNYVLTHQPD